MSVSSPAAFLVNPPVYDFAAHDLWMKPRPHNNSAFPFWTMPGK